MAPPPRPECLVVAALAALLAGACWSRGDAGAAPEPAVPSDVETPAFLPPADPATAPPDSAPPSSRPLSTTTAHPMTLPTETTAVTQPAERTPVARPVQPNPMTLRTETTPAILAAVHNPVTRIAVLNPVTHLVVTDFVTPTVLPATKPSSSTWPSVALAGRGKATQAQIQAAQALALAHPHPCRPGLHRPHRCEAVGSRLYCSGGVHRATRSRRTELTLCFWSGDLFDPGKLRFFPLLRRLQMTESNITEVLDFPYHDHLEELVLAGLRLTWLSEGTFLGLRKLSLLDLSGNQLSFLDGATLLRLPSLKQVMLAGNPWRCTLSLSWMVEEPLKALIADRGRMQCGAALYPRRPVITVVALLKHVAAECPADDACACELTRLVRDAHSRAGPEGVVVGDPGDGALVPIITVNCSHRGLAAMPRRLPANTTTLLLRGNHVAHVRPLLDRHPDVLDVYLDDNLVESVADLEGSPWLSSFRVLSLRANKLQQLPTYALDNALERNVHAVRLYLGLNPWRCDCQFMPNFQELLAKYKSLIADWDDIRCAAVEGDDNSLKKIHGLSRGAVCRDEGEPRVTALDLVNAALGLSLLAVLAKLALDFWRYRRYGRLPWIAAKLP